VWLDRVAIERGNKCKGGQLVINGITSTKTCVTGWTRRQVHAAAQLGTAPTLACPPLGRLRPRCTRTRGITPVARGRGRGEARQ
jgi:hypothetical protein